MSRTIKSLGQLLEAVRACGKSGERTIVAIAGPPGAGKSTLADSLVDALNDAEPASAAVLSMDGYHYDDMVLVPRGLRPRKGAPETYDVAGFGHMLMRLKANEEDEIAVPVFDRTIEISRAGARMIPRDVRFLIVEGNYVLLDEGKWRDLHPLYDMTVLIREPEEELRRRLEIRWRDLSPEDLAFKLDGNDLPNARRVMEGSTAPDIVFTSEPAAKNNEA